MVEKSFRKELIVKINSLYPEGKQIDEPGIVYMCNDRILRIKSMNDLRERWDAEESRLWDDPPEEQEEERP